VSEAPLYQDVAEGPAGGRAVWLTTADGVRIRAGLWNQGAARGTVVLLPGRTEYIEKYGRTAAALAEAGYATLSIDFRGQGLADRPLKDKSVGHVGDFAEYQADVDTLFAFAAAEQLPQPWYLLVHSMGGAIGLRALIRGVRVRAAVFSAPMWGIVMPKGTRPVVQVVSTLSRWFGFAHLRMPTTPVKTLVIEAPFGGNNLTTDEGMWNYMRRQALAHPDLTLGGPSLGWMKAALREGAALAALPSPTIPAVCAYGSLERIVETAPIHSRMIQWPGGRLDLYDGAEHEVLMERPGIREPFVNSAVALFEANR
jgi:lysophospholipase